MVPIFRALNFKLVGETDNAPGVAVAVGLKDAVGVAVRVAVGVAVSVAVLVAVGVALRAGVRAEVAVAVRVGDADGVAVGVAHTAIEIRPSTPNEQIFDLAIFVNVSTL